MAKGDHRYKKAPKGSNAGGYRRSKFHVSFDADTAVLINRLAEKNDRSFAAEVRALVDDGLALRGE